MNANDEMVLVTDARPVIAAADLPPIVFDPADVARWAANDAADALADLLGVMDYMRAGDGSLPHGGPAKIQNARAAIAAVRALQVAS